MKAVVVLKEIKRCGGRSPLGRLQPGLSRTRLYFNQSSTPRYFQPFQPISVFLSSSISKSRENTKIASDYHTRLIWNILKMGKHQDQQTHHTLDQKLTTKYIQQYSAGKNYQQITDWVSTYLIYTTRKNFVTLVTPWDIFWEHCGYHSYRRRVWVRVVMDGEHGGTLGGGRGDQGKPPC